MRARRIIKTERGETSSGRGWRVIEAEGRGKKSFSPFPYKGGGREKIDSGAGQNLTGGAEKVEISCLVCGKTIEIPQFIDTDNYDGQINCPSCKSLLRVRLVGAKARKYEVVERGATAVKSNPVQPTAEEKADVKSILKYIPLRDYLTSYHASQLNLSLEHIEHILDSKLEAAAYAFKSWWENDRKNPQAIAWLEAGWEVEDINTQQKVVVFKRVKTR